MVTGCAIGELHLDVTSTLLWALECCLPKQTGLGGLGFLACRRIDFRVEMTGVLYVWDARGGELGGCPSAYVDLTIIRWGDFVWIVAMQPYC